MTTTKNTQRMVPIALGVQVGHIVRGTEELCYDRTVDVLWFEGTVTSVNNGLARINVTSSENDIFDGDELIIFTHNLKVVGR